jgi:hypothetical protein
MSMSKDFVASAVADAILPLFRRSMEDVVYETLDDRAVPTRADFKDLRDLVDNLRGQVSGTTNGVRRLAERGSATTANFQAIEDRLAAIEARLESLATGGTAEAPPKSQTLLCKVESCDEKYRSKGFCARHYQQWRRGRLKAFPYPG